MTAERDAQWDLRPGSLKLVASRRRLYHVCRAGAYEGIFAYGLLSTAALLAESGWESSTIGITIEHPREDFIVVKGPGHREVRLSHQRPIKLAMLDRCLDLTGTSRAEYFRLLATRVFLFPTPAAGAGFRAALLIDGPIDIISIDTLRLLRLVENRVEVSRYNSGSTPREPIPKGRDTWTPIATFGGKAADLKEVTVLDRLDDVESLTVSVVRETVDGRRERVW